jgi:ADP-ribose pyrophosphatase
MENPVNPWEKLSSRLIYENPWIKVEEDQILNAANKPGIYGKVHFKNLALAIIPVDKDMNTWLVGQFRYTLNTCSWEIPMGGGLSGEDPLLNAQRELKEETGISAAKWKEVMKIHTSNSVTDELGIIYLAEDLSFGKPEWDETELLQIKKVPLATAVEMVMTGTITDSISVGGLLKVGRMFGF